MTIYFNKNDEAICGEPPEGYTGAVLTDEEWHKYASPPNVNYKIEDGKFVPLYDADFIAGKKEAEYRISQLKTLLSQTDYVVSKISEASVTGGDVESLKVKYAEEMNNRQSWRKEINELEEKYNLSS